MKRINSIIIAAIAIMAMSMSSCKKDVALQRAEQEEAGTISVSVDAVMGEYAQDDASKAGLVSTTRVRWQDYDKVYVFDGAKCLGVLLVTLKDDKDYYACLNSLKPLSKPQADTKKLTLVYSNAFKEEPSITPEPLDQTSSQLPLSLSTQDGDTKPDNIPFLAFATLDYTSGTPEISGQIADFSLATSLMRLNCSGLAANAAITGATLTGMSNECLLKITKDGAEIIQGNMGDINVYFKGVSANAKGTQTLYAAVAQNLTESAQTLEIQQTKKYCYNFGSKARNYAKAYNAICQMKAPFEYVEIGGKKWGKMNLGATTINDLGKLYSWGNLDGQSGYNFDPAFTEANYQNTEGARINNTDYVWDKTKHDAAYNELGGSWRMPTKNDFVNLDKACGGNGELAGIQIINSKDISGGKVKKGRYILPDHQTTLKEIEGLKDIQLGGLLYSDGENYLFFIDAGLSTGTYRFIDHYFNSYWSSTWYDIDIFGIYGAFSFDFGTAIGGPHDKELCVWPQDGKYRWNGLAIRPVSD